MFFLSKSPNRETYFSSRSLEYFKKSRQLYVGMSILNARNIAFLCTDFSSQLFLRHARFQSSPMIKASHPRSNSSLSGVPIAPKSSVIKSSIGVHPLIFIFSFVIIICSPFIIFLHKKSPPTQRYFHKLPLSGLRNTNKTNNILCNYIK